MRKLTQLPRFDYGSPGKINNSNLNLKKRNKFFVYFKNK